MPVNWSDYQAVLFDLDGVITPTAAVHMHAWSRMFNEFLTSRGITEPYTDDDYFNYVDGRPRYDGVRAFLESRDIHLPEGTPSDAETEQTVCGLGNRKNSAFNLQLEEEGVEPYPGSVRLLDRLKELGVPMALVSSSRNAPAVMTAAHVEGYFSEVMHGGIAAERGLAGKPAPDTYRAAAEDLGATVEGSVVVEDAVSGVQAGAAGNFGLVIGVDRGAGSAELLGAGADIVVQDLEELL